MLTSTDGTDDIYEPPKTDTDHVMDALMEIRIHVLGMLGTLDRLLWFMKVAQPAPFDQDGPESSQEIQPL